MTRAVRPSSVTLADSVTISPDIGWSPLGMSSMGRIAGFIPRD